MKKERKPGVMYVLLLALSISMSGCMSKSMHFAMEKESVLSQMKVVSRPPIQFSEIGVDEVTAKMIADETETALSPAIKQIQGKVLSPDKYVSVEEKYRAGGYFDTKTGQFSWEKFKKVLDTLGSDTHLEISYVSGTGETTNTTYGQGGSYTTTTHAVPTLELSATLYSCETGTILWQSKYLIWTQESYWLKTINVKSIWDSDKGKKSFKKAWKQLGQDICELTPNNKCMEK